MRPSSASHLTAGLSVGLAFLALVSPALGASSGASPALPGAAPLAADASPSPAAGSSPAGSLAVTRVGDVDSGGYPSVSTTLSIIDAANGRPETSLDASSISVSPQGQVDKVEQASVSLPTAYLVLMDVSGSMAPGGNDAHKDYMASARALARSFAQGVGADDLVKVATFDTTDTEKTGWLHGDDPALGQAIDAVAVPYPTHATYISQALTWAAGVANARPAPCDRRAIVVITDASPADKDPNLSSPAMKAQLGSPMFIVGLLPPDQVGTELTQLLSDVATYTGGTYQAAANPDDADTVFQPVFDSAHLGWKVTFSTNAYPDGGAHEATLTVTDPSQRSGQVAVPYQSGGLFKVSPLSVAGISDGDAVTLDRTITVSVGGDRVWPETRIDLYLDCDPATCTAPTATSANGPLSWKLLVAPMGQGKHRLWLRLTTHDDKNVEYQGQLDLTFSRTGTTWNVAAVVLVGGIGLLAAGAFFIASRRRARQARRATT